METVIQGKHIKEKHINKNKMMAMGAKISQTLLLDGENWSTWINSSTLAVY